jgi:hypothetical protein
MAACPAAVAASLDRFLSASFVKRRQNEMEDVTKADIPASFSLSISVTMASI